MKHYFFLLLLCLYFYKVDAQETAYSKEATALWRKTVNEFIAHRNQVAVINIRHFNCDTINDANYTIVKTNKYEAYLNEEWGRYYKFTKDSVYMVNVWDNELMVGAASRDFYQAFYQQEIVDGVKYFESLLYPYSKNFFYTFSAIKDTLVNNLQYSVLQRESKNSFIFNPNTKKYDIPNFYLVDYYYNTNTEQIDYICATPTQESVRSWKKECYLEYYFTDSLGIIDDIFDFGSTQYVDYSRHNDENLPYSWSFADEDISSSLSKQVVNYPIVSLSGDSSSIAKEEGWLLLDFWWFSCRYCLEWIAATSKEKEKNGQRILESNGIKIMSINAISDNQEKLAKIAEKFGAADIIYSAKGMGELISIYSMPQYYLISPDKKIVLKSNDLGDYSEVLKVKQKWESKHKRK